ncbi:5,6-dimethylbenzimidazole synthase [Roseobacter sp. HKCCA0434]|uniref:5,6-dimethylbenzimidazole synthase n=1 Tax=Roseobacter sp. HKCCA0434 TaxID=3079297 RepID=UPI0029058877|nr:5,6-dimethylbenzimidazole synthase [Roseobacter sp. HKCCA0434]
MRSFDDQFRDDLTDLFRLRRDVRRFRSDPVPQALLDDCLAEIAHAPSVGLAAPWRILRIDGADARASALSNFEAANADALAGYDGEKAELYAGLKLSGMRDAPVQLAFFCNDGTPRGSGLGAGTMPQMRAYSVVGAIMYLWLAARARGLGLGWVSILDPDRLCRDLDVPDDWALVGYLCLGWPEEESETPELVTAGWEDPAPIPEVIVR